MKAGCNLLLLLSGGGNASSFSSSERSVSEEAWLGESRESREISVADSIMTYEKWLKSNIREGSAFAKTNTGSSYDDVTEHWGRGEMCTGDDRWLTGFKKKLRSSPKSKEGEGTGKGSHWSQASGLAQNWQVSCLCLWDCRCVPSVC